MEGGVHESAHKMASGLLDPNDLISSQGQTTGMKDKKTYFLDTSAFMTAVNIVEKGPKKIDESIPKAADINQTHAKLNELVTDLGTKISDVIKDHENDFFVAFKNKMYAIMKEMRELKEKASSERHKAKQEARLINLEKERDWFRREALKLDKMCKDHKRILNKLKATLENIEEDRDFFQEQLFNAKKVNKALLMELEKYKTSLMSGDALALTNSLGMGGSLKLPYGSTTKPLAIQHQMDSEDQNGLSNKFSTQKKGISTLKLKSKIDQAIRQQPDDVQLEDPVGDLVDQYFKMRESGVDDELNEQYLEEFDRNKDLDEIKPSDYKIKSGEKTHLKNQTLKSDQLVAFSNSHVPLGNSVSVEEYRKVIQENAELKDRELKYAETIRHLKNQIDSEKKNARSLRAEKVNFMMQRNELEEFFLQCIEEVRKDIVKRKAITAQYSSAQGTNKKSMKRSTSTASMSKPGSTAYQEDTQIPNAKLDQYTATDKRKVIELLMSNENVLLFLYEKLFPATNLSSQSTQSRLGTAAGMSQAGGVRFTTDSGVPIGNGMGSASTMIPLSTHGGVGRSQTTIGGSRVSMLNGNRSSGINTAAFGANQFQNYAGIGTAGIDTAAILTQSSLPNASLPGMSIQNNIQNLNLNINLSKGAYGSAQFIPNQLLQNRGATAPLGQARTKKGLQGQLNALGGGAKNKYAI